MTMRAQRLRGRGALAFVIKVGSALGALVMFSGIARSLGPMEFGLYAFGISVALFNALALNLGLPTLVLRYLPAAWETGNPERAAGVLRHALARALLGGALSAMATGVAAAVSWVVIDSADRLWFWVFTYLLALAWSGADLLASVLRGFGSVAVALLPRDILWRFGAPVLVWGAHRLGAPLDATGAMAITAILLAVMCLGQLLFARGLGFLPVRLAPGLAPELGRELDRAVPGFWGSSFAGAIEQNATVAIVGWVLGEVVAGEVFLAMRVANLLSLPLIAANVVAAPQIAVHHAKGEAVQVQRVCREVARASGLFAGLGLIALALFGRPAMGLFGPDYAGALPLLMLFAFGQFWNAASGSSGYLLSMTGHAQDLLRIQVVSNLAALPLVALLAVLFGPPGAASGIVFGVVVWNTWARARSLRLLGIDPSILSGLAGAGRARSPESEGR